MKKIKLSIRPIQHKDDKITYQISGCGEYLVAFLDLCCKEFDGELISGDLVVDETVSPETIRALFKKSLCDITRESEFGKDYTELNLTYRAERALNGTDLEYRIIEKRNMYGNVVGYDLYQGRIQKNDLLGTFDSEKALNETLEYKEPYTLGDVMNETNGSLSVCQCRSFLKGRFKIVVKDGTVEHLFGRAIDREGEEAIRKAVEMMGIPYTDDLCVANQKILERAIRKESCKNCPLFMTCKYMETIIQDVEG